MPRVEPDYGTGNFLCSQRVLPFGHKTAKVIHGISIQSIVGDRHDRVNAIVLLDWFNIGILGIVGKLVINFTLILIPFGATLFVAGQCTMWNIN